MALGLIIDCFEIVQKAYYRMRVFVKDRGLMIERRNKSIDESDIFQRN